MNYKSNLVLATVASIALLACQSTGGSATAPRKVRFSEIHQDPSLIGKVIRFHSCLGIPLSDVVDESEDFLMLFQCGTKLDESVTEDMVIFARLASMEVAKPIADAKTGFGEIIEADLTGTLSKEVVDKGGDKKYLVLTIQEISNPKAAGR